MRRLVRESGPDLPLLVLHAGCDALGSGSPDHRARWRRLRPVLVELLRLGEERQQAPPPVLIRGRDILEALEIEPGPRVGELLRAVADAQEAGRVHTRAEALRLLRELTS